MFESLHPSLPVGTDASRLVRFFLQVQMLLPLEAPGLEPGSESRTEPEGASLSGDGSFEPLRSLYLAKSQ